MSRRLSVPRLPLVVSLSSLLVMVGCGGPEGEASDAIFSQRSKLTAATGLSNGLVVLAAGAPIRHKDFNGDGVADFALFRPSTGEWISRSLDGTFNQTTGPFGLGGDYPVPADYTGDGLVDMALFRPMTGEWFIGGSVWLQFPFGEPGDIPVPGDFDGDGKAEPAVYRARTNEWILGLNAQPVVWGQAGDIPCTGDFDGDGKTDIALFRPGSGGWSIYYPSKAQSSFVGVWGWPGDVPIVADYDGDGRDDIAVWRPSTGTWWVRNQLQQQWGEEGDLPVPADYDGDGKADLVFYRPSTQELWALNLPSMSPLAFGAQGDRPAQATAQGVITCDLIDGCLVMNPQSWRVLDTVVRAHLNTPNASISPQVIRPWILVGECEGGSPRNDLEIELAKWSRGFKSPDRGPYQISPIHFFKGTSAEWTVVRAAWTKQADYYNNDIAHEDDLDNYGYGYRWEEMMDPRKGAEFGVMLAARSQVGSATNFGPWYKSYGCHGYVNTVVPVADELSFPRPDDFVTLKKNAAKRYVRIR